MHTVSRSTIHRRTFACLLLLVVVCSSLFPRTGYTAATSPWLTPDPTLTKLGTIDSNAPLTADIVGNQDCQPAEIITRPERTIPPQSKQSHDSCLVDTGFGALSASGYLQRQGSDAFGYLRSSVGNQAIVGIPRTNNALATLASSTHGTYVGFYDNLRSLVSSTTFSDMVTHTMPNNPSAALSDHTGNKLGVELSSLSFSSEGDWAVVEAPGVAMLRINTASHLVLPFSEAPLLDNTGLAYRTAINADGRYAIVISKTRSLMKLYDLSTCAAIPDTIAGPVSCTAVDLLPFIKTKITNYTSVASVRFRGDYTLELYINTSAATIEHVLITASGQSAARFEYLALGDSFASGEGAYQYKSATDTTANGCHLSLRSYPYLIAKQLSLDQTESVACSGATTNDLINGVADYRLYHSQAKGKESEAFDEAILRDFLPGYRAQKLFANRYRPRVLTVMIGGNDVGFSDILQRCLGPDTCYSHYEDRLELLNEVSAQFNSLAGTFSEIKHAAPDSERIYVLAYPQIADAFGNCALNVHLNYDELVLAGTLVSHLNSIIKGAAEHAGVTFLNTEDALHGHRLCETTANSIAVNGLTIGNDILNLPYAHGPIAKESYHPNSLGHELMKSNILSLASNFSVLNKAPNPSIKAKQPDTTSDALKVPKSNRAIRKVIHQKSNNPAPAKKKTKRIATTKGVASIFRSGKQPRVLLDGQGEPIGTVTSNPDDSITVEFTPTDETPDGPHTVDIVGENTSGEPIAVTETVVVGDSQGPCGAFAPSNTDVDHDGIDDACDPLIGTGSMASSDQLVVVNTGGTGGTGTTVTTGAPGTAESSIPTTQTPTTSLVTTTDSVATPSTPNLIIQGSRTIAIPINPTALTVSKPKNSTVAQVTQPATNGLVKGRQTTANSHNTSRPGITPPASAYKNPPKLDVLKPCSLFLLITICLVVMFVIYKRRKDRR